MKGYVEKNGCSYRRFKVKRGDKWVDHYVKVPHPTDPRFAEEWARVNKTSPERAKAAQGTMRALIIERRRVLAKESMADKTRADWYYYLGLMETEHGHKLVKDLRKSKVYQIRDEMADTPGKANVYLSKLRALLEFACERDWITTNPAKGVKPLATGEHDPWPVEVVEEALAEADLMLGFAIVSGLCSGQRVSDVIRMQHGWHDRAIMSVPSSVKTKTAAYIPMHPLWLAWNDRVPRRSVTLLYDRFGKPFTGTDRIQERIRRLMTRLGHVDENGKALYTFHGLSKNACCYLVELGLSDREVGEIVGKTPETVRHYSKRARSLMIAQGAAERVVVGKLGGLVGK